MPIYTHHRDWQMGEMITALKMNNIEDRLKVNTPGATNVAPFWDNNVSYDAGDYVIFEEDGLLYKSLTNNNVGNSPEYNSLYWEYIENISAEIKNIKNELQQEIATLERMINSSTLIPVTTNYSWAQGSFSTSTGELTPGVNLYEICTTYYYYYLTATKLLKYIIPENFKLRIFWYDSSSNYLGYTDWVQGENTIYYNNQAEKYKLVLARTNGTLLAISAVPNDLVVTPLAIMGAT